MHIDVVKQIGAVTREVTTRDHEGKPAKVVIAERTYGTTPEDLWDAVTSAERIPRWFTPISGELTLGGRYQLQGNAGGTIQECAPPRHFRVTWEFGGATSWVDVVIEPAPNGSARLTLEHIMYPDDHWKKFGPGATGVGWDMALMGLDRHVATGLPNDPAEGMAWMMSDEGKSFSRQSSDAWGAASVASGEDPAVAKAAAEQTTAAYTGA
jgi:uncharacterized protein YndB with AHSA1/START domain